MASLAFLFFLPSVADDHLPQSPRSSASPVLFQFNSAGFKAVRDGNAMGLSSSDSPPPSPSSSSLKSEYP